ncbi:MAG: tRNA uridine-5-carboxymethylaminomethyl(34) synthesis GTPase MnmE, partial [Deltaproteobacteria bacterium]
MSTTLEFESKNVEKALQEASEKLNIPVDKLKHDVISYGSSGIFGLVGTKKAKIRVVVPEDAAAEDRGQKVKKSKDVQEGVASLLQETFGKNQEPKTDEPVEISDAAIVHGKEALERLVDSISSDAQIEVTKNGDKVLYNVFGGNSALLIGKRGQTLEALQYLVEKIVNKKHDQRVKIQVDIEGYLKNRKERLEALALRLGEKVKRTGKPVTAGQFNAYDRRIIHVVLKVIHTLFRSAVGRKEGLDRGSGGIALKAHRTHYGYIIDPESLQKIDEVLVIVMRSPKSYTREDVVEIQSHSGYIVLDRIFQKVLKAGARIAENGEFTKRAFLNGRIDLTQAEAVCDIIHAKSSTALHLAARQLTGRLKDRLSQIRTRLYELLVSLEAAIDFPEDAAELMDDETLCTQLRKTVAVPLQEMTRHYRKARYFKDGIRMAVIGRPNVGKSSLLNCLAKKDRAIVSAIPGTTRDFIEESFDMAGLPVTMVDTAGIQEPNEIIEKLGIEKTLACIDEADLILFMLDLSRPFDGENEKVYEKIKNKAHIVVQNKIDLIQKKKIPVLPNTWQKSPT